MINDLFSSVQCRRNTPVSSEELVTFGCILCISAAGVLICINRNLHMNAESVETRQSVLVSVCSPTSFDHTSTVGVESRGSEGWSAVVWRCFSFSKNWSLFTCRFLFIEINQTENSDQKRKVWPEYPLSVTWISVATPEALKSSSNDS